MDDDFTSRCRLVRPLEIAESHFLEVLVTKFALRRKDGDIGAHLGITFDNSTPAIWLRHAKYDVERLIHDFEDRSERYQKKFDSFFLESDNSEQELIISDDSFPYRYASGGTLPIVRQGGKDYFCLFYRDIKPIGWNIANGACDNRDELLNPLDAVERELGEELVILDPDKKERYVFEWNEGRRIDRPEFAVTRRIWSEKFRDHRASKFQDFKEVGIALKWLEGPDSLSITDMSRPGREGKNFIEGFFLNINAADFGIEIDRIAKINLGKGVVLCDGEVSQGQLLDRPIGLFPVSDFSLEKLEDKFSEYKPEKHFYNGRIYDQGSEIEQTIDEFIKSLQEKRLRTDEETRNYNAATNKFGLCPVTKNLIWRYIKLCGQPRKKASDTTCDIFISFGGEDRTYAREVYSYLRKVDIPTFFSDEEISTCDYHAEIDEALQSASNLVAVATNPQHLRKHWVNYECRAFHILRGDCADPKDKQLFSLITGFDYSELPLPLRAYESISFDPKRMTTGLKELAKFLKP
jgi:hypothetical protein